MPLSAVPRLCNPHLQHYLESAYAASEIMYSPAHTTTRFPCDVSYAIPDFKYWTTFFDCRCTPDQPLSALLVTHWNRGKVSIIFVWAFILPAKIKSDATTTHVFHSMHCLLPVFFRNSRLPLRWRRRRREVIHCQVLVHKQPISRRVLNFWLYCTLWHTEFYASPPYYVLPVTLG